MRAIKKHFGKVKFDLITYSTPPITFTKVIEWAKRNNPKAVTYLQLKDIFPQNAVDLGMMSKTGAKGVLYRRFRKKEERLYEISDWIGCMSPANVRYVMENNPRVPAGKVEICPNSYEIPEQVRNDGGEEISGQARDDVRAKYGLPEGKPIFFYGGNLGKPQGIPFLIKCLEANKDREDCHFLVVGNGFEYPKIKGWYESVRPKSVTVMQSLPKADYDQLAQSCDVGLISLDYRFTIPNYPSRLLSYLMGKKPIIACTDVNCDTGTIAEENGYGFWAASNDVEAFGKAVDKMLQSDIKAMGERGYEFFLRNYTIQNTFEAIVSKVHSS